MNFAQGMVLIFNFQDRKNDVNRSIIHDLLVTILKDPTDENLRCVAQVLKVGVHSEGD